MTEKVQSKVLVHQTMLEIANVSQGILGSSAIDVLLVTMDIQLVSVSDNGYLCLPFIRCCSGCPTGIRPRDILLYV